MFKKTKDFLTTDLGLQFLLVVIFALFFVRVVQFMGFDSTDEAWYLICGLTQKYPLIDWSPVYSMWYSFLFFFSSTPSSVFFLNVYLVSFLILPIAVFHLARRLQISSVGSFCVAFLTAATCLNLNVYPRVQAFNFTFLLLNFLFFRQENQRPLARICFYFFLVVSLYVRQDNIFFCLVFLLADLFYFKVTRPYLTAVLPFLVFLWVAAYNFRSPLTNGRFFTAFYFAYDIIHHDFLQSKFPGVPREISVGQLFHAKSIFEAFVNEPFLMIEHIGGNILRLVKMLFQELSVSFGIFSTAVYFLLLVAFIWIENPKAHLKSVSTLIWKSCLVLSVALLIRVLVTTLLLYPDRKYMLEMIMIFPLAMYLLFRWKGFVIKRVLPERIWVPVGAVLICAQIYFSNESFFNQSGIRQASEALSATQLNANDLLVTTSNRNAIMIYSKYYDHKNILNPYESSRDDHFCQNWNIPAFFQADQATVITLDRESFHTLGPLCYEKHDQVEPALIAKGFSLLYKDENMNYVFYRKK